VVLSTLVVAAWPVADGQAQTSANQATPRRAAAPTAPAGGETTQPAGRQILPVIRQDVPATPTPTPTSTPTPVPRPLTDMAVGAGVIDNNYEMVRDMGFPWVKLNVDWAARPDPATTDAQVDDARSRYPGVKILLRIDNSPASARTGDDDDPIRQADLYSFLHALALRERGKVQAYELFNEPNLRWEWNLHIAGGGNMPSAAGFARVMQLAHPAIKSADENAIVVAGGLSPSTGGGDSIADLDFLNGLYDHGAAFDAIGAHPYGGGCGFDASVCGEGIYFRRAELYHLTTISHGDGNRPIWATELGWIVDPRVYGHPECMAGLGGRAGWVRSPADVGYQLSMAYRYAIQNWPWMGGMFFFNLDYAAAGWVQGYDKVCDAPTWYAIVSKNNMPPRPYVEPAYGNLLQVARDYRLTSR